MYKCLHITSRLYPNNYLQGVVLLLPIQVMETLIPPRSIDLHKAALAWKIFLEGARGPIQKYLDVMVGKKNDIKILLNSILGKN